MNWKHVPLFLIGAGVFLIVAGFGGVTYWLDRPVRLQESVYAEIKPGMSGRDIGRVLQQRGVLTDVEEFRWALWIMRAERDLKVGRFRLNPPLTRRQLVRRLTSGHSQTRRVRILEGWPSWRVYGELAEQLDYEPEDFQRFHADEEFLERVGVPGPTLEGYLFPDTYRISLASTPEDVLSRLVDRFYEVANWMELERRAEEQGLTLDEAVRLASIIEREGTLDKELPTISAVFHERLDRGMNLQADPTVLYAYRDFSRPLTWTDLEVESPYNTYRNRGLPPGAISNPGRRSLEAAVAPADVSYLYFFARGDGSHAFSKTLEEHRRSIRQYRD